MNIRTLLRSDYFKLFVKRESKVVLGRHYSNLWLLFGVLTATFFAIAFSNASMDYLSYKMNDPFINWVDIKNEYGEDDFSGLESALADQDVMDKFHYNGYQADYYFNYHFWGADDTSIHYFRCRFFEKIKDNTLIKEILKEENLVKECGIDISRLENNSFGVIITEDAMNKLGYSEAPAYLNYSRPCSDADTLGFRLGIEDHGYVPLPVLGVVKRLPGNIDLISTKYFYEQDNNSIKNPLHLNKRSYASELYYFIPDDIEKDTIVKKLEDAASQTLSDKSIVTAQEIPSMINYKTGTFVVLRGVYGELPYNEVNKIHEMMREEFTEAGICRIFNYDTCDYELTEKAFISVYFNDLDVIREFEMYVKDNFNVTIEMSQINAKENFNAVSLLANILSWSMIVFAIICIILFIVNLLQSYFQKVKRNLGTFKAFGISNAELISVYVLIMIATVCAATVMSLSLTYFIEVLLNLLGFMKDETFGYLDLWSIKTLCSIIIILAASISTVYLVMNKLLKTTPGNLIYDR